MKRLWRGALPVAIALAFPLAACSSKGRSGGPAQGTSAGVVSSGKPGNVGVRPTSPIPSEPPEVEHFERIPTDAATRAKAELVAFLDASATDMKAYHAFRRAVSCGEPFFRERPAVSEPLFGAANDATGGPLGRLDAAVVAGNRQNIDIEAAAVKAALSGLQVSFDKDRVRLQRVAAMLPLAAYTLGAILAGSKPKMALSPRGAVADAEGHLDAIEQMVLFNHQVVSPNPQYGPAFGRVRDRLAAFHKAFDAAEKAGELTNRASLTVQTGLFGAELRALLGPSSDLWMPPAAAVSAESTPSPGGMGEPIGVLTLPRRFGPAAKAPAGGKQAPSDPPTFSGTAPIDRFARGDEKALSDEARRGFDVAAGKGRCLSCHAPPLFGIASPPAFQGVSETPSLRRIRKKEPYFHDIDLTADEKKAVLKLLREALAEPH